MCGWVLGGGGVDGLGLVCGVWCCVVWCVCVVEGWLVVLVDGGVGVYVGCGGLCVVGVVGIGGVFGFDDVGVDFWWWCDDWIVWLDVWVLYWCGGVFGCGGCDDLCWWLVCGGVGVVGWDLYGVEKFGVLDGFCECYVCVWW